MGFTRRERIAVVIIVFLILVSIFLPNLLRNFSSKESIQADTAWIAAVKKLEIKDSVYSDNDVRTDDVENTSVYQYDRRNSNYRENKNFGGELFYFDPNIITANEWKRLGLRDKTIQTIQNYLSKGGHFYKPEDLQKIYGLQKDVYERLLPYVKIGAKVLTANKPFISSKPNSDVQQTKTYAAKFSAVEINTADTSAFISLPGIGSKLALRIVNFRDKLGGFHTIDQIGEIYGLPDSTFQKIKQYLKLDNAGIKKININTATVDELKAHPYIKYSLANPIVAYRNEHGAFSKIEDIKKIMAVTEEIYKKIAPYLVIL